MGRPADAPGANGGERRRRREECLPPLPTLSLSLQATRRRCCDNATTAPPPPSLLSFCHRQQRLCRRSRRRRGFERRHQSQQQRIGRRSPGETTLKCHHRDAREREPVFEGEGLAYNGYIRNAGGRYSEPLWGSLNFARAKFLAKFRHPPPKPLNSSESRPGFFAPLTTFGACLVVAFIPCHCCCAYGKAELR